VSARGPDRSEPRARGVRRHLALAIGVSAALHAALLAAIGARRPAAPEAAPLTVSLVEIDPGADAAAPPASPGAVREEVSRGAPPRQGGPPGAAPRRELERRGSSGQGERHGGVAVPPPRGELSQDDVAGVQGWFDAHGLGSERRSGRHDRGGDPLAVSPPWEGAPDEEEDAPAARAKKRVDAMIGEMRARDLTRYPDASWMDLRDALARGFGPDFGLLANTASPYLGAAEAYGRTGRPFASAPDAPGRAGAGKNAAVHAAAEGNREREALAAGIDALAAAGDEGFAKAWTKALVTVISVVEDGEGVVTDVLLAASSGNQAHDRLALEQGRRLVGRAHARRLAGTATDWAFVTELSVVPPRPVAGVALDEHFKPTGALFYPLRRAAKSRIELVALRRAG
jgi:hypothetical protein